MKRQINEIGTRIARYFLREKYSALWWITGAAWSLSYHHIGWWFALGLVLSAVPVTILEVLWNDYMEPKLFCKENTDGR